MNNPSLSTAWSEQAKAVAARKDEIHSKPDGTAEACRTNARILVDHVEQAFRDAGYFPMMLLLGTLVRPVIDTGRQCNQCIAAALAPHIEGHPSFAQPGEGPHKYEPSGHVVACGDGCCREESCALCGQHEDANPDHEVK